MADLIRHFFIQMVDTSCNHIGYSINNQIKHQSPPIISREPNSTRRVWALPKPIGASQPALPTPVNNNSTRQHPASQNPPVGFGHCPNRLALANGSSHTRKQQFRRSLPQKPKSSRTFNPRGYPVSANQPAPPSPQHQPYLPKYPKRSPRRNSLKTALQNSQQKRNLSVPFFVSYKFELHLAYTAWLSSRSALLSAVTNSPTSIFPLKELIISSIL